MSVGSNLVLASEILKTKYTEAFRNGVKTDPTLISEKIMKNNKGYEGEEYIEAPIPVGVSGGFGFGDMTGLSVPEGANVAHKKFKQAPAEYFVAINLLHRLVKAKREATLIDYLDTEINGAYTAAKWNIGRAIWGNGIGKLGTISSVKVVDDEHTEITFSNRKQIITGILVDIYASNAIIGSAPVVKKARVDGVSANSDGTATVTLLTSEGGKITEGCFMTVQNSYGREIVGIGSVFDDEITHIHGLSKAENPWLRPVVKDAQNDITMTILREALDESDDHNGKVDVFAMGGKAYSAFSEYAQAANVKLESSEGVLKVGHKAITFQYLDKEIAVYQERFVPENEIWGIGTQDIEPHMDELDYTNDTPDTPVFERVAGTSIFQAMMASYGNYIIKNPGGFIRIKNANAVA